MILAKSADVFSNIKTLFLLREMNEQISHLVLSAIFFVVPFITGRKPLRVFSAKENIKTPSYAVIGAAYTIARC